ncbi:hypothetical protein OF83DRAFT_1170207 [Amylostereum chailletii]|nr:hypothetical protein OF83DRAFT_1170207 [Amylostereum chailletii]
MSSTSGTDGYVLAPEDLARILAARQANSQLPIFRRSPLEVLLRIATFLSQDTVTLRSNVVVSAAVPLLRVCSRWREVALACRDVWTTIPFRNVEVTQIFLDRSYPAPIQLRIEGERLASADQRGHPTPKKLAYYNAVLLSISHLSRARVFSVNHLWRYDAEKIFPLLSSSVPELEELSLIYSCPPAEDEYWDEPMPPPLSIFSDSVPPKLRKLELEWCSLHTTSPLLQSSSLIDIDITDCRAWETVDDIVAMLARLPQLEAFTVRQIWNQPREHRLFRLPTSAIESPHSISLPRMQKFVIDADFRQGMTLFHRLSLPVTALIEINGETNYPSNDTAVDAVFILLVATSLCDHYASFIATDRICDLAKVHMFKEYISLAMRWESLVGLANGERDAFALEYVTEDDPRPNLQLTFHLTPGFDAMTTMMDAMMDALPILKRTETVVLSVDYRFPDQLGVRRMFEGFKDVRNLSLANYSASDIVTALGAPSSPLFPALSVLRLSDISLVETEYMESGTNPFAGVLQALEGWFTSGRVETLNIYQCDVTEEVVTSLRAKLGPGKLVWDMVHDSNDTRRIRQIRSPNREARILQALALGFASESD